MFQQDRRVLELAQYHLTEMLTQGSRVSSRAGASGGQTTTPRPTLSWERQAGEKVEVCACSHMQLHAWTWIPFLSPNRLTHLPPPPPACLVRAVLDPATRVCSPESVSSVCKKRFLLGVKGNPRMGNPPFLTQPARLLFAVNPNS